MAQIEIVAFADEHVGGAAEVLARRHAQHRGLCALLPEIDDFTAQVRDAGVDATGAVAIDGDRVVGYLLGRHAHDAIGAHIWSHVGGQAVDEPAVVQDLYVVAAARWVDEGCRRHFVFVPSIPALVEPWFRLSFGASAALAARPAWPAPSFSAPGVTVRRVSTADMADVARLERELYVGLAASPSFSGLRVDSVEVFEDEWRANEHDERYVAFLAETDGETVGQLFLFRRPAGDLRVPPRSIDLASASVWPEARGRGIGSALTGTAFAWARDNGVETVITDWRMSNLVAARYWPARGFEETFLRLYRSIP